MADIGSTDAAAASQADSRFRHWIAVTITALALVGVIALAAVALARNEDPIQVLTMVLPVIGTWVGTVLAFYFGTANFQAASQSALALTAQLSPIQRLSSKPISAAMISRGSMFALKEPPDIVLAQALAQLKQSGKGERIPVLDANDNPVLVVHRSTLDGFIAAKALAAPGQDLTALTLADMLKDPDIGKSLATSFGTVNQDATLADAKMVMEALPACQDVFVTKNGTKSEPVLGWVTNNIIEDNSKV